MTPGEIYETKRNNFINNTLKYFEFLCSEYGFDKPIHDECIQENGVILNDYLKYENRSIDRLIVISNSYHPVDYGFEINFYKPSISIKHGDSKMVYYVLKEKQDVEQSYLFEAAKVLKNDFEKQIKGETWFKDDYRITG